MMSRRLRFHPEAESEFADAIDCYTRNAGKEIAVEFAEAVDAAVHAVQASALTYPRVWKEYRRFLVKRFPYGVFYEVTKNEIYVVAVYHLSRSPTGWHERT